MGGWVRVRWVGGWVGGLGLGGWVGGWVTPTNRVETGWSNLYLTVCKHTGHWMVIQLWKEVAVCCMHAFYYSDSPQDCGGVRHAHTVFYQLETSSITSYASSITSYSKYFNHENNTSFRDPFGKQLVNSFKL